MLSEGSLSLSKFYRGESKYFMTMDVYSLNYLNYFYLTQTVLLCTESFTKEECIILQSVL